MIDSRRNSPKELKKAPKESEPEEVEKKDPRGPRFLNAQALGIYGLIVGISSRENGRLIMQLSMMSPKKKNLLIKTSF
jgi:hypothetical protein